MHELQANANHMASHVRNASASTSRRPLRMTRSSRNARVSEAIVSIRTGGSAHAGVAHCHFNVHDNATRTPSLLRGSRCREPLSPIVDAGAHLGQAVPFLQHERVQGHLLTVDLILQYGDQVAPSDQLKGQQVHHTPDTHGMPHHGQCQHDVVAASMAPSLVEALPAASATEWPAIPLRIRRVGSKRPTQPPLRGDLLSLSSSVATVRRCGCSANLGAFRGSR
ncbi:MAG: hypothetical protein FAZ92_00567 [Accumulibacter sp.]|nr:MAG: hypothetical protein FAZ92_00567 [Accumulibacter sp.]